MSFTDSKSAGQIIASSDYNDHVDFSESISSNLLTWKKVSGLSDITPSSPTQGQVLAWDSTLSKYTPSTITVAGTTNLSDVIINTNKGWKSYGISGLSYLSSQTLSGQLTARKIIVATGTDGLQFYDTNAKIYRSTGDDLVILSEDDIIINSDDDVDIQRDGTTYARFYGNERKLYIADTGGMISPAYTLQVNGNISGSSIIAGTISGSIISGTTIYGTWAGDEISSIYIMSSAKWSKIYHSGNEYSVAYASSQIAMYSIVHADDIDDGVGGGWDSTAFTNSGMLWNGTYWVPMPSGGSGGGGSSPGGVTAGDIQYRIDASTFGGESNFNYDSDSNTLDLYHLSSITISAQIISGGAWSGAVIHSRYIASSSKYSNAYQWFNESSQKISLMVASGNEYSAAYASAQATKELAYKNGEDVDGDDLTWDGTEFNVDSVFLRNDGDTSTSHKITATKGFSGPVSGARISGGTIIGTWAGDTINNVYLDSGSEFQLAYTWYSESSSKLSFLASSGNEYSQAYASAQALKVHSFHHKVSSQYIVGYIASSTAKTRFLQSGNIFISISSQAISGGTIVGNTITTKGIISSQAGFMAHYISANSTNITAAMGGSLVSDMNGASYTYGLDDMDFVSSQTISGGTIKSTKLTILKGTDGIQFVDANTKIYESGDDLYIDADDDIILNADDNVDISIDGTSYARFDGNVRALYINKGGTVTDSDYTLHVVGDIYGTTISGTKISGGAIKGTWAGDEISTIYLESSAKFSNAYHSGSKYTDAYQWMINSGAQYTNILESGVKYTQTYTWMINSGTAYSNAVTSGLQYTRAYGSSQIAMYKIQHADDLDDGAGGGWDSVAFENSGMLWDGTNWVPMPSGGSGGGGGANPAGTNTGDVQYRTDATTFGAEIVFNYDSASNTLRLYHSSTQSTSSQTISGGTIIGTWNGDALTSEYITGYVASSTILTKIPNSSNSQWIYNWITKSGSLLSNLLASGNEYSEAYSIRLSDSTAGDDLDWDDGAEELNVQDHFLRNDGNDSLGGNLDALDTYGINNLTYISSQYLSGQLKALHSARDISGWDSVSFTNSGLQWNGTAWVASSLGLWKKNGQDIYYGGGEVIVGHNSFDMGDYKFQVSGDSYFSGAVQFIGEISGLSDPTYASGVATKHYVDVISGNIKGKWGWDSVSDGGTIAHGCSSKPTWVTISPSGVSPIAYSLKVDATNITVYHTSPDSETFSWRVFV